MTGAVGALHRTAGANTQTMVFRGSFDQVVATLSHCGTKYISVKLSLLIFPDEVETQKHVREGHIMSVLWVMSLNMSLLVMIIDHGCIFYQ